jgi:hypothetical protein
MELSTIAIVNKSTKVTDADGNAIVNAIKKVIPEFCTSWNVIKCNILYVAKGNNTSLKNTITLIDKPDPKLNLPPGVLGFHDNSASDNPYGIICVETILKYGGGILTGNFSVAQTVSHEVFEALIDPIANCWWDSEKTGLYASEVCDPVQSNVVNVSLLGPVVKKLVKGKFVNHQKSVVVSLSDWILPPWCSPENKTGPYNYLKTLKAPFTLDQGGYAIQLVNDKIKLVFGSKVTDAEKDRYSIKHRISGRLQKRL